MARTAKHINVKDFQEPMVLLPLKHYESLIEYIEDNEDRLTIIERRDEPLLSHDEVDRRFKEIFGEP